MATPGMRKKLNALVRNSPPMGKPAVHRPSDPIESLMIEEPQKQPRKAPGTAPSSQSKEGLSTKQQTQESSNIVFTSVAVPQILPRHHAEHSPL